jgi:hypothetical protein
MSKSFPVGGSGNSLKRAIILALLIDVPFIAIFLLVGGTEPSILLTFIFPIMIGGLIVYSSYAAARMEYVLEDDGLRIRFPMSPLRISYRKIRSAGKVETSLSFRLFGGSLPGAHFGTFTTSTLGRAQVYATRYKGEFVLLELTDGTKVLISPREPDALLEALRERTIFTAPQLIEVGEPRLDRRLATAQITIVAVAWIALVAYIVSIYPGLPDVIPVHFGFNGVPNRYGSKVEMLLLAGFSAIFPVMNTIFTLKFGKYNKGLTFFLCAVFLLAIGLFALVVNQILSAL